MPEPRHQPGVFYLPGHPHPTATGLKTDVAPGWKSLQEPFQFAIFVPDANRWTHLALGIEHPENRVVLVDIASDPIEYSMAVAPP
jgi:hypothetical protein